MGGLVVLVVVVIAMIAGGGSDDDSDLGAAAGGVAGAEAGPTTSPPDGPASVTPTPGATAGAGAESDSRPDEEAGAPVDTATPYCGSSRYVEEITVQRWADGRFRISVWPTPEARDADDRDAATAEIWRAVRRCVTEGLDGQVGESLQDQLRCHEFLAWVPGGGDGQYATGETYDLESWRPTAGRRKWISTRCGNTLGTDPTSPPERTYRPDGVPPQHTVSGEQA